MKNKKNKKSAILGRLSNNLSSFYPELDCHFMCPTCLVTIPLTERYRISEAHIIPRAAGGSLKTYICTACNSKFGAKQDKWLGEYLEIRRRFQEKKETTFLDISSNPHYFLVDGTRVQGTYHTEANGDLSFYIHEDRTDPEALRTILSKPPKTISVSVPFLRKQDLVDAGFLTAAYLLWFKEIGYSWALQAHLDGVRRQIQNPAEQIIERRFWLGCSGEFFEQPWVGVLSIQEEHFLVAAIADRVVLLPPADRKDCYSILKARIEKETVKYHRLRFADSHQFGPPAGVIYGNRLLVSPDPFLKEPSKSAYLFFPPGRETLPEMLFPITEEEAERSRGLPNHEFIKLAGRAEIPLESTGRPHKQ